MIRGAFYLRKYGICINAATRQMKHEVFPFVVVPQLNDLVKPKGYHSVCIVQSIEKISSELYGQR